MPDLSSATTYELIAALEAKLKESAAVTEPASIDNTAPAVDNTAAPTPDPVAGEGQAPAPEAAADAIPSAPSAADTAPADPAELPTPTADDAVHLLEQAIAILQQL